MIQKIKNNMLILATLLMTGLPMLVPVAAHASIAGYTCSGTNIAAGDASTPSNDPSCASGTSSSASGIYALAKQVVNVFSVIVGIVAVIMIIFGGFKYITSGGDSGHVTGAKNTLIYAIVGLIIVALAQFIVHFVLTTANSATTG